MTKKKAKYWGVYDFETSEWTKPVCCGLKWKTADGEASHFIYQKDAQPEKIVEYTLDHMAFLSDEHNVKTWSAYNGGKFDALFLVDRAMALGWTIKKCVFVSGRIISATFISPEGDSFSVRDTMTLVSGKLKKVAESFQLKSQKLLGEDDYSVDAKLWSEERLKAGCMADCDVLMELIDTLNVLAVENGGDLKMTTSGTALSCLKSTGKVLRTGMKGDTGRSGMYGLNRIIRKAYFGGRNEVYKHKPKNVVTEWDINSSYPWSMSRSLPYLPLKTTSNATGIWDNPNTYSFVYAKVQVKDCYLPVLPWRHDKGGMYFPTGVWESWFAQDELKYAIECGHTSIIKMNRGIIFTRETPFKEFVDRLYSVKSTSTGAKREFVKLILNGSYGKFAQKPEKESYTIFPSNAELIAAMESAENGTFKVADDIETGRIGVSLREQWDWQAHYGIASAITAASRVLLHTLLSRANDIAYTDTDSIHACATSKMPTGKGLGELKIERDKLKAEYFGPKMYSLHPLDGSKPHFASKGFRPDASTFTDIVTGIGVKREAMQLGKSQLRHNDGVKRTSITKQWKGKSSKRAPLYGTRNGDTRPWHVSELETNLHTEAYSPLYLERL